MPKRKNTKQIPSPELQGEDSWIEMKAPKVGDMKTYRKCIGGLIKKQHKLQASDKMQTPEMIDVLTAIEAAGHDFILEHIVAWNWVDDDDKPLPQPHEEGAIDLLEVLERDWLLRQFQANESQKKG